MTLYCGLICLLRLGAGIVRAGYILGKGLVIKESLSCSCLDVWPFLSDGYGMVVRVSIDCRLWAVGLSLARRQCFGQIWGQVIVNLVHLDLQWRWGRQCCTVEFSGFGVWERAACGLVLLLGRFSH